MNDIERLQAHIDIARLLHRYAECIDGGDFAAAGKLFANATVGTAGTGEIRGEDAARTMYEQYTRRYADGTPRSKHIISNIVVDFTESGDTATSHCYFQVLQQTAKLPLQPICAGRYHDAFSRVEGIWQFSRRTIHLDLVGDLSQHLLKPVSGDATP